MSGGRTHRQYTVVLSYDRKERVFNVSVPSLPGCHTWGRTKPQAVKHAREAIRVYLDTLRDTGARIPSDDVELLQVEEFNKRV